MGEQNLEKIKTLLLSENQSNICNTEPCTSFFALHLSPFPNFISNCTQLKTLQLFQAQYPRPNGESAGCNIMHAGKTQELSPAWFSGLLPHCEIKTFEVDEHFSFHHMTNSPIKPQATYYKDTES